MTLTHSRNRCSSHQIDGKTWSLGVYTIETDAARAFDKVASILGRPLNFPNSKSVKIAGSRSKGADGAVAGAVETAKSFMASVGTRKVSSIYTGVSENTGRGHQWQSTINVSLEWWVGPEIRKLT